MAEGRCDESGGTGVRRRKREHAPEEKEEEAKAEGSGSAVRSAAVAQLKDPGSYWLTRIVYIRALGLIYCNNC